MAQPADVGVYHACSPPLIGTITCTIKLGLYHKVGLHAVLLRLVCILERHAQLIDDPECRCQRQKVQHRMYVVLHEETALRRDFGRLFDIAIALNTTNACLQTRRIVRNMAVSSWDRRDSPVQDIGTVQGMSTSPSLQ